LLKRVAVALAALFALLAGPLAVGRAVAGQDLTAMTNADRVSRGLRALSTAGDLQSLAQQRADQMARSGQLSHTVNLGSKVSGWQRLGENVGRGPKLQDIETAFMNSPSHRENILDPAFTQLGVGVTFDGKQYLYVAVIFRQPSGSATAVAPSRAPAPAAAPRASAAPKPAPRPATTTTRPPTTTTTAPPTTTTTAPPPPPPPPVETPPAPVETTTTTAPRPIYTNPDFLSANFAGKPAAAVTPRRGLSLPLMVGFGAVFGAGAMRGGAATARRRVRGPKP